MAKGIDPNTPAYGGVVLTDYEKGGGGTAVGSFKVPASTIKRFRKDITDPNDPNATINVFDAERAFNEIAQTYINAIVSLFEVLRKAKFSGFPDKTRTLLRKAVYNAIEFSCLNKQLGQNINGSSISTPGFNIAVDNTSGLITSDMIGMKAGNYLTNSQIKGYKVVTKGSVTTYTATDNDNIQIIGKWDEDKIPELS